MPLRWNEHLSEEIEGGASGLTDDSGCGPLLIVCLLVALALFLAGVMARHLGGAPW